MLHRSIGVEVAVGDVNKFMSVGEGEVSMLEDEFLRSCFILCDTHMVNTGGEFGGNVIMVFPKFGLAMWIGPENCCTISVEGSNPITLGADSACLAHCSSTDSKFLSFPKLN